MQKDSHESFVKEEQKWDNIVEQVLDLLQKYTWELVFDSSTVDFQQRDELLHLA